MRISHNTSKTSKNCQVSWKNPYFSRQLFDFLKQTRTVVKYQNWVFDFLMIMIIYQKHVVEFCDVVEVVIIHKMI